MITNIVKFEYVVEGKICQIFLENGTPFPIAKEMAFQFMKELGDLEDRLKNQQEQMKKEEIIPEVKTDV